MDLPSYQTLKTEIAAPHVLLVTLNRPEVANAFNTQMGRDFLDLWTRLTEDAGDVRCAVLTGAGDKAFSAGADVNELRDVDPAGILAYYRETGDVYERIAALPQPTISAIAGWCLGGGLELALATDFRIADETAVLVSQ